MPFHEFDRQRLRGVVSEELIGELDHAAENLETFIGTCNIVAILEADRGLQRVIGQVEGAVADGGGTLGLLEVVRERGEAFAAVDGLKNGSLIKTSAAIFRCFKESRSHEGPHAPGPRRPLTPEEISALNRDDFEREQSRPEVRPRASDRDRFPSPRAQADRMLDKTAERLVLAGADPEQVGRALADAQTTVNSNSREYDLAKKAEGKTLLRYMAGQYRVGSE